MLEKPDIPDSLLIARLQDSFGLPVHQLTFLPLGADVNSAVYRAVTLEGTPYFVKLRQGDFSEIGVALPQYLTALGVPAIIPPLETCSGQLWADLDPFKVILYPFVEGQNGYEVALSDRQWRYFGAALKAIHATHLPPKLSRLIPDETFSPHWRELVKTFLKQVEESVFDDPVAVRCAAFINANRDVIVRLVQHAEDLCRTVQARHPDRVLCHGDVHAGNLLLGNRDALHIVDWDTLILAPKERDLALVGGCRVWNGERGEALFYKGYNPGSRTEIDRAALAYYRCERILTDVAEFCKQLLWTAEGGKDREQSLLYLTSSFLPGRDVEIALRTDPGGRD